MNLPHRRFGFAIRNNDSEDELQGHGEEGANVSAASAPAPELTASLFGAGTVENAEPGARVAKALGSPPPPTQEIQPSLLNLNL
jgi:hypothetical protein